MNKTKKINISCNKDCGAGCPLTAHVKNNRIIKISNNDSAPEYFNGCPRGFIFHKVLYSKDRLLKPLLRNGERGSGKFKEISWEKALNIVSEKIKQTIARHNARSILVLPASGSCRGIVHNTDLLLKRFASMLGECTYAVGNYSSHAVRYTIPFVLGTQFCGIDPLTLFDSKMIVLWGANIIDTRFGGRTEKILKAIKRKNIPIIAIDPRYTNTAKTLNTEWIKINPATDTAFMMAVAYILIQENLIDEAYLKKYTKGFEQYKNYLQGIEDNIPKSAEWAAEICGTTPEIIKSFAIRYGKTKPAALISGLSIQRTIGGEEATRSAIILQAMTKNIGINGGSSGVMYWSGLPTPKISRIFTKSQSCKITFPVYEWPDRIINKDPSDIKFIYNSGNNFLNQGSDIKKNIKAYNSVDFIVTHDSFMTPTAQFSDIILPTTMWPERSDVMTCTDNYLFYSNKVVAPPDTVKNDFEIFEKLSEKLGFKEKFTENRTADEWLTYLLSTSEVDDIENFKETGIYEGKEHHRVAFSSFINNPEKNSLNTPSGLIEIYSDKYSATGFPGIPKQRKIEKNDKFPLIMITPHARLRINSSNANIDHFNNLEDDTLWINPDDATERNIEINSKISIFNQRGSIEAIATVTDKIQKGTVSINQGIWAKFQSNSVDSAPNILTSSSPTLPSHGSRTHLTFVEIKKLNQH